jgi:hypothetical protein
MPGTLNVVSSFAEGVVRKRPVLALLDRSVHVAIAISIITALLANSRPTRNEMRWSGNVDEKARP